MRPIEIRETILRLLAEPALLWSEHPLCLAHALGYELASVFTDPDAKWRTLKLNRREQQRVSLRLSMIVNGEIRPMPFKRVIPGGFNDSGAYPDRYVIDWRPSLADDRWRCAFVKLWARRRFAVKLTPSGFHVEHC